MAKPDYNREQRIQGCGLDAPLNEVGIAQAEELAKKLMPLGIEHIYASNLKRALQTGTNLCRAFRGCG